MDNLALEITHSLRWGPLTTVFVVASAWWVKWPLIAFVGGCADATRRHIAPVCAVSASIAAGVAALSVALAKEVTDRARPPLAEPSIHSLVPIPDSTSLPSGHAATAFAAATVVALLYPRLRVPLFALAALVAVSRAYLGVHYWSDVVLGSLFGVAIGWGTVWAVRQAEGGLRGRVQRREPA